MSKPARLSRAWFASQGSLGGSASTPAKRAAAKRNLASTPTHRKRAEALGTAKPAAPPAPKPRLPDPPHRHD